MQCVNIGLSLAAHLIGTAQANVAFFVKRGQIESANFGWQRLDLMPRLVMAVCEDDVFWEIVVVIDYVCQVCLGRSAGSCSERMACLQNMEAAEGPSGRKGVHIDIPLLPVLDCGEPIIRSADSGHPCSTDRYSTCKSFPVSGHHHIWMGSMLLAVGAHTLTESPRATKRSAQNTMQ